MNTRDIIKAFFPNSRKTFSAGLAGTLTLCLLGPPSPTPRG